MISFSIISLSTAVEVLNSSWLLSISSGRVSLSACYQIPMIQTSELNFSRYNLEMMISKNEYLLDPLESLEDILAVVKMCMRTYYLRLQRENNNRCWKQRSDRQQVHIGLVCICGIDQCRKYIYIPNYSNYQPKSFIHNMHFQLFVMYLYLKLAVKWFPFLKMQKQLAINARVYKIVHIRRGWMIDLRTIPEQYLRRSSTWNVRNFYPRSNYCSFFFLQVFKFQVIKLIRLWSEFTQL